MKREEVRSLAIRRLDESRGFETHEATLAKAIYLKELAVSLILDGTPLTDEDRCILVRGFHELSLCARRHEPKKEVTYVAQRNGHHKNLEEPLPLEDAIRRALVKSQVSYPNADLFPVAPMNAPPISAYCQKLPLKTRAKM